MHALNVTQAEEQLSPLIHGLSMLVLTFACLGDTDPSEANIELRK